MKKLFALFLAVSMFAAYLSGCKKNEVPKDPVTLTLWHVYGDQADSAMNRLVEEFNATVGLEEGILINVTNVASTSKIRYQLLDAQAKVPGAMEMPDIFSCHSNMVLPLGAENLVDWNDYFSEEELSDYIPAFLEDGTVVDDKLSVFPVSKSTYTLYVNRSLFDKFSADTGVSIDSLSTWDGFFDTAARYYEWSGGKTFCAFDYFIRHIELDMQARDGEFTYTEDGWYDFANPSLQTSWDKFATSLVQGHIAVADQYSSTQVMTGEALAGIGSTAGVSYYNDIVTYPDNTSEQMNLTVLPLPRTGTGKEYMPQTGVGIASYKTTEEKAEAAAVFVRWLTEGKRNLDFVAETGYMPVNSAAFDAIESFTFADDAHTRLYAAIREMYREYTPVVRPDFDNFYERTDALYNGLRELQPVLKERSDKGESTDTLIKETWDLFRSIR